MIRIRLAEEDRTRYQLGEWIEYDVSRPKLSDIRALKQAGYRGWVDLETHLYGDDRDEQLAAVAVVCWLAINRHHPVSWDDFDLDLLGVELAAVEDPNRLAPTGASTSSTGTSPSSRRSTASARGRSTS